MKKSKASKADRDFLFDFRGFLLFDPSDTLNLFAWQKHLYGLLLNANPCADWVRSQPAQKIRLRSSNEFEYFARHPKLSGEIAADPTNWVPRQPPFATCRPFRPGSLAIRR